MTDWKKQAAMYTQAQQQGTAVPVAPSGGTDFQAAQAQYNETKANTPVPDDPVTAAYNKYLEPVAQDFSKHYSNGAAAISNGLTYAKVLRGEITIDEAKATAQALNDTKDLSSFGATLGPLVEQVPMLTDMAATFAQGVGAGGLAGAATGLIGGPAAPLSVPAATVAGAAFGGNAAVIANSGMIAAGNILQHLTDAGVPVDKAKSFAISGGLAVAALQQVGVGIAGKTIMQAAQKKLVAKAVQNVAEEEAIKLTAKAAPKAASSLWQNAANQYLKQAGQTWADITAQDWAEKVAVAVGKGLNGKAIDVKGKNLPTQLGEGAVNALAAAAVLPGVGKLIGSVAGKALSVHKIPDISTPHKAADVIGALFGGHEMPDSIPQFERELKEAQAEREMHESVDTPEAKAQRDKLDKQIKQLQNSIKKMKDDEAGASFRSKEAQEKEKEKARKEVFKARQERKQAANERLRKEVQDAVERTNAKGDKINTSQDAKAQARTRQSRVKQKLKTFGISTANWRDTLNTLFQYLPRDQREALIDKLDFGKRLDDVKAIQTQQFNALVGRIEKSTGKRLDEVYKTVVRDADANSLRDTKDTTIPRDDKGFPQYVPHVEKPNVTYESFNGKTTTPPPPAPPAPKSFQGSRENAAYLLELMDMARAQKNSRPSTEGSAFEPSGSLLEVKNSKQQLYAADAAAFENTNFQHTQNLYETIHKMGYTFEEDVPGGRSTEAVLKEALASDPTTMRVMEGIKDYYQNDHMPLLKKAFENNTGERFVEVPGYFGQLRREVPGQREGTFAYMDWLEHFGETSPVFESSGPGKTLGEPRSTEERTNNTYPVQLRSAFTDAVAAGFHAAQYAGLHDIADTAHHVWNDGGVRDSVAINFGENANKQIDMALQDMLIGRPSLQGRLIDGINSFMREYGHKLLQLNVVRYLKHYAQVTTYGLADLGKGKKLSAFDLAKGMADYYRDPATANKYLWENSQALRNKYIDNSRQALVGAVRESDIKEIMRGRNDEFLNTFLIKGAQHADQAGMWAVLKYCEANGISKGKAIEIADRALQETQFSNAVNQISNLSRQPEIKALTMFTQYPTALFSREVTAWREAANFPSKENLANAVRVSAITRLAQGLFIGVDVAYVHAMSDDPERRRDAWLRLGFGVVAGAQPLSVDKYAADAVKMGYDFATHAAHNAGMDVEPTNTRRFGVETIPGSVIDSAIGIGLGITKAVDEKVQQGETSALTLWNILLDATRVAAPQSTSTVQAGKDLYKKVNSNN